MARSEELAPEAAAVAAFLSDISDFLDDEEGADHVTTRTVRRGEEKSKCPPPEDEAARKRVLHNAKSGKRRDAYRQRQKEKLQTLRSEEVELATRLEELQQRRRTDNGGVAKAAWRAVAMRQLEGKRAAEAQQEKLKLAVKRRRELIQDVESTLRKRLREVEKYAQADNESSYVTKRNRVEPSDDKLFEAYLEDLDAIYAKTDHVFQFCESTPTKGPFLTKKPPMRRDGVTEYFENVGVLHVPFKFERTCLALWEVTHQPYRQLDREEYDGVGDTQNTIAVRFRVECRLRTGGVVSTVTHFVSRRYVEASRTVIVWRELWEGESEFEGIHWDETGWCIVQPGEGTADDMVSSDTSTSLIKTCVRLVPMHFSSNISCEPDFDRFTDVLVTSGKEDNEQVEQMMERMQLGDAIAGVTLTTTLPSTVTSNSTSPGLKIRPQGVDGSQECRPLHRSQWSFSLVGRRHDNNAVWCQKVPDVELDQCYRSG